MKIAITSIGPTLADNVKARFGRCAYFLIIKTIALIAGLAAGAAMMIFGF